MHDPAPDLNLQLLILFGMLVLAIGGALLIERRIQRKEDEQIEKIESN